MKKILFPKYSIISSVIAVVLIGICILLNLLKNFGTYIYLFGIGIREIECIIISICAFLFVSALAVLLYKNARRKVWVVILTLIITLALLLYLYVFLVFSPENKYYEHTSDDKKHTIIVNEMSWFFSGGGVVYEKTSFCTMKRIGRYNTDDGYCPLRNGQYFFVWNEDDFELHYSYPSSSLEEYIVVKMKYLE